MLSKIISVSSTVYEGIIDSLVFKKPGEKDHARQAIYVLERFLSRDYKAIYDRLSSEDQQKVSPGEYFTQLEIVQGMYSVLSPEKKRVLGFAVSLHDIGYCVIGADSWKHNQIGARYLLDRREYFRDLLGCSYSELEIISRLVRYHGVFHNLATYVFPGDVQMTDEEASMLIILDCMDMAGRDIGKSRLHKSAFQILQCPTLVKELSLSPHTHGRYRLNNLLTPFIFLKGDIFPAPLDILTDSRAKELCELFGEPGKIKAYNFPFFKDTYYLARERNGASAAAIAYLKLVYSFLNQVDTAGFNYIIFEDKGFMMLPQRKKDKLVTNIILPELDKYRLESIIEGAKPFDGIFTVEKDQELSTQRIRMDIVG